MCKYKLYRHLLSLFIVGILMYMTFSGCEHLEITQPKTVLPNPGEVDTLARFSAIQSEIFNNKCALSGCHVGGGNQLPGVLDLREGMAFQNLVGVQSIENPSLNRIEPGMPDSSYLFLKITGNNIVGAQMPFGRDPLPEREIEAIRKWISGAANN